MSYPILYDPSETNFGNNGFGILSDCASCYVVEEANGMFEMYIVYPMDGIHFEKIKHRSIIKAKVDNKRDPQLFRVYSVTKSIEGLANISAQHISYDLSGIPVLPYEETDAARAFGGLKRNSAINNPFDFYTDITLNSYFGLSVPTSARAAIGGVEGSILATYGGELEYDNFNVTLHSSRGENKGVTIRYGKNLTNLKQDQNCSNIYTGVFPYWAREDEYGYIETQWLTEHIVPVPGFAGIENILVVDFSQRFEERPTESQLRNATNLYIESNSIGKPVVSMSVSFEQLSKSEEYKDLSVFDDISLFDTVSVEFPELGVNSSARVTKTKTDVLNDRIDSITLGSYKHKISDTIADQRFGLGNLVSSLTQKRVI